MDEHLIALEKRMQQLQEAVRQALTQHDTFQVRLLGAELTRTQHAWDVLCGLSGAPDAVRPEPAPTVTEPHRDAPYVTGSPTCCSSQIPGVKLETPSDC